MLDPLVNRIEKIEVQAYIEEEKVKIGMKYIVPKVLK